MEERTRVASENATIDVETTFVVRPADDGQEPHEAFFAFFAEHVPTEFENDMHYLQDAAGEDVEPLVEEGGGGHDGQRLPH